ALSECQLSTGDEDASDETLDAALQTLPANGAVHVAKTHSLRNKSMPAEALEHIRKAVDLDPERADWLIEYGDLLRELGRAEESTPILQSALDKQPENWKAREALALTYESQGEMASAASLVESLPRNLTPESLWNAGRILVQTPPEKEGSTHVVGVKTLEKAREAGFVDTSIDYWIAHGLRCQDRNEEAINHYQIFLDNSDENPNDAHLQGVLGLADAAIAMDDATLAIATMEKHRGQYATSLKMLMLLAKAHMSNDDFSVAKNLARQAFERNPIETEALSILSIAAEADGSLDEAITARKQLANLQPTQSDPWLELARLTWLAGNKDDSRKHLARGLSLGRRDKQILQKAAALCGEFKFHPLQLRLLQGASFLDEHDPEIHTELALAAENIGDFERAQRAWMHIADLLPNDTRPLDRAADALWKLDKRTAAIGLWEQATQIDPENALHFTALGQAYSQVGEIQRSLNCFGHALALQPDDPAFLIEAGSAMTYSGSPEEGLGALQKAVSIVPNDPVPLIALAETLHLLGRHTDARAALDRAAILAPLSVKGFALQAITSLETGEIENAKEAFNTVSNSEAEDFNDVLWSARSAVALANWDAAIHS
ncbi:MAG: tetratricopeptide repeat protein, partial [Anaerolineales bacterium]|nr:tetratricopeptide repeat protein [Anaerolineales bacterium]